MSRLGRDFDRLWAAHAASTLGSAVATDAIALIAVLVLSSNVLQVSLLSALGGAAGALLALPLSPWVEFRRKRPVMIGTDLLRCCALATVPLAYAAGALTYVQLATVSVLMAVSQTVFVGASGAHLKSLVAREDLTEAHGRYEGVLWVSMAVGPPAGGLLMSSLGPTVTVLTDAVSYLLSAIGVMSIARPEPKPPASAAGRRWWQGLGTGWSHVWSDAVLRPLFVNFVAVGALITAITPVWAVIMLRELHFGPFEYGLSVGIPCVAGVVGARLSPRFAARRGNRAALLSAGVARVLWLPWLPFAGTDLLGLELLGGGPLGLAAVTVIHTGTVFCMSVFNPVVATQRVRRTPDDRLTRVLTSWSISNNVARACCTVVWGVLATLTTPRIAIAAAVVLLLATCVCLPWRRAERPAR